jgi:zinc protease
MQILPLSLSPVSPPSSKNAPYTLNEDCRQNFGPLFAALRKEPEKRLAGVNATATPPAPAAETTTKVEETAVKELLLSPTDEVEVIDLEQIVPFDPQTICKTLENGFTYYIRKNDFPAPKTASLRLVVRAGSTDEQESERGMAHFLEHLVSTYDTENFTSHQIQKYFESVGAIMGPDQNAYTSYNETFYKLDIPLTDPKILENAIWMMSEWAFKSKLSAESVEQERRPVLDEIQNKGFATRYNNKKKSVLFEGTPYAERDVAGLEQVIKTCTAEQVQAFYKRWYQPNNIALVAVGDFDPENVEALIKQHFSAMPASPFPPATHKFTPISHIETRFVLHQDPEVPASLLELYFPLNTETISSEVTWEGIRQGITNNLCQEMFTARLNELISESTHPPFTGAHASKQELRLGLHYFKCRVTANNGEFEKAFKQMLLEIKRAKQHGFLPEELEEAKEHYLAGLNSSEKDKDYQDTKSLASVYADHFSDEDSAPDLGTVLQIKKKLLETVSLAEVNRWFRFLTPAKGTVVTALTPESPVLTPPTKERLEQLIEEAAKEEVQPYVHVPLDRPLLRTSPVPGKIVETKFYEKEGVTEWVLENGMHVFVRPSQYKENQILSFMVAKGGKLASDLKDRASVEMAEYVHDNSGLAGLTSAQLKKFFKQTDIIHLPILRNYSVSFIDSAPKDQLESLFQLLHASIADPGYRSISFEADKKELINDLKFRHHYPDTVFIDTHVILSTQNHPAFRPLEPEEIEKADYETAISFLNKRFSNPANFNLTLVGNLDLEAVKPLVERYLAGIPQKGPKEEHFDLPGYEYPAGIATQELEGGIEASSKCHISFPAPVADEKRERQFGTWTAFLVRAHLINKFRWEQGQTYGVSCSFSLTSVPGNNKTDPCSMELMFTALPENMASLREKITEELARIQAEGFTEEEYATFKAEMQEERRKAIAKDATWMVLISSSALWGWGIDSILEDYNKQLDEFSPQIAQEMTKKLFPLNRYTQVTMHPKK